MTVKSIAAAIAALTISTAVPALAQTKREVKVDHDTKMHDGVATSTTKVTEVSKRKTNQPKKVLGVKVGNKTVTKKTVRESSVSSDGDRSVKVKTSN